MTALPRGSTTGLRTALESDRLAAAARVYANASHYSALYSRATLEAQLNAPFIANGDEISGRHIGLRVGCGNMAADGNQATVYVNLVKRIRTHVGDGDPSEFYALLPYCSILFTAGTMQFASGRLVADTAAITLLAFGTHMEARTGARVASVYSPAGTQDNNIAIVQIPDIDNCDGIVLDSAQSSGSCNPMYEFTT